MKRFLSWSRDSIPDSMSSTMMRLALVPLVFANDFTLRAARHWSGEWVSAMLIQTIAEFKS